MRDTAHTKRTSGPRLCPECHYYRREMAVGCFPKAGWGQLQADAHGQPQWVSVMEMEPVMVTEARPVEGGSWEAVL